MPHYFLHRIKGVLSDLRLMASGAVAILRYARMDEHLSASISLLQTAHLAVNPGVASSYRVDVLNCTEAASILRVLVDIYRKDDGRHPEGHYSYFTKEIIVPGEGTLGILIRYDWNSLPRFTLDGVDLAADSYWRGPCSGRGWYRFRVVLQSKDGADIEALELMQEIRV